MAWGLTAFCDPHQATPLHLRPLTLPAAGAGPSRPKGTQRSRDPQPQARAAPSFPGPPTQVTELGEGGGESFAKGGVTTCWPWVGNTGENTCPPLELCHCT